MTQESYIQYHRDGSTTFVGPDANRYFMAMTLWSALKLYGKHKIRVSRGAGPKWLLSQAKKYTGKDYKRGEYLVAAEDVKQWADTMKMALPTKE